MSRATNRTSNISVTWNFKNPNISRNELINFIHLFRKVPGYSRGLSRHCLAISAVSRFSTASRSSSDAISPFLSFISHRTPARKSPERLSSPSQRPPESHLKGFPPRFSVPPKVPRLRHLKSRDSCCLSILYDLAVFVRPYLHFHQSPARRFPERISSPIQRTSESFPTTPPEISRFPFGTKVIKILDLSPYLPPTRPFTVSPTLSYSPKPVFPIPQSQSFTNHATRLNPLLSLINLPARSILISPCLTTTLISPVHHFLQLPSSLSRQAPPHCYPSDWEFTTRHARNCTEFEAVSTYVTLKKNNLHHLKESFRSISFSHQSCATGTLLLRKQIYPRKSSLIIT